MVLDYIQEQLPLVVAVTILFILVISFWVWFCIHYSNYLPPTIHTTALYRAPSTVRHGGQEFLHPSDSEHIVDIPTNPSHRSSLRDKERSTSSQRFDEGSYTVGYLDPASGSGPNLNRRKRFTRQRIRSLPVQSTSVIQRPIKPRRSLPPGEKSNIFYEVSLRGNESVEFQKRLPTVVEEGRYYGAGGHLYTIPKANILYPQQRHSFHQVSRNSSAVASSKTYYTNHNDIARSLSTISLASTFESDQLRLNSHIERNCSSDSELDSLNTRAFSERVPRRNGRRVSSRRENTPNYWV